MPAGGHGAGAGKAFHGGPLAKVFKVFGMEPGRKPYEFGSNLASHSGSRAILNKAWRHRSWIVGIPSGRNSFLPAPCQRLSLAGMEPGFGIQTRRKGLDLVGTLSTDTKLER
jgi:hypothetical protein